MLDCRQNVLTSINTLLRRIALFQSRPDEKHFARFISGLVTEVELLRNDLVLVFNQNFYLRCKLDQREQQLQVAEKRLAQVTSRMELSLQMSRLKYEKQIQALKFARFLAHDSQDAHAHHPLSPHSPLPAKTHSALDQQQRKQQQHPLATVKKQKQFAELRPTTGGCELRQAVGGECEFDLQVRGLVSEEQGLFSNNRLSEEMVRSNEVEEQHSKKRRRAGSSRKEESSALVLTHRKKKSEELAELVAMQFKVHPIKEKYFSTDLL